MSTGSAVPNADGVYSQWAVTPGGVHYSAIDEGMASPDTSDYITSSGIGSKDQHEYSSCPADVASITEIKVRWHGRGSTIGANLLIALWFDRGSGLAVYGNTIVTFYTVGVWGSYNVVFDTSADPLTKAEFDTMQIRFLYKDESGGHSGPNVET